MSDKGYAKDFLNNFNGFLEQYDKREKYYNGMVEVFEKWSEEFPDDANLTCAHVIIKIPYLNEDELVEFFQKVKTQEPIDGSCHLEFLEKMTQCAIMNLGEERFADFYEKVKSPTKKGEGRNFAEEFKRAYKNKEYFEAISVFNDWSKSDNHDSNYHYASAIVLSRTEGDVIDDAFKEFELGGNCEADDESLNSWFRSISWKTFKQRMAHEGKLFNLYICQDGNE